MGSMPPEAPSGPSTTHPRNVDSFLSPQSGDPAAAVAAAEALLNAPPVTAVAVKSAPAAATSAAAPAAAKAIEIFEGVPRLLLAVPRVLEITRVLEFGSFLSNTKIWGSAKRLGCLPT